MKRSDLSKAVGGGVITFNLVMLPLVPVSAQTTTAPGGATTGTSPSQETTSTRGERQSSWGCLGLLGLLGLASLFRLPSKSSSS